MNRLFVLCLILFVTACGPKRAALPIGDVVADPARYGEQTLELKGEVSGGMGLLSVGIFTLSDATGEITVLTGKGLPAAGSTVIVRGQVQSGITIGGVHYGTSLREEERLYPD